MSTILVLDRRLRVLALDSTHENESMRQLTDTQARNILKVLAGKELRSAFDISLGKELDRLTSVSTPPSLPSHSERVGSDGGMWSRTTVPLRDEGADFVHLLQLSKFAPGEGKTTRDEPDIREIPEHRFRRASALVSAVASRVARKTCSPAEFVEDFQRRMENFRQAMTASQGICATGGGMLDLVHNHLKVLQDGGSDIRVSGAPLHLNRRKASIMSLAMRELVSEAVRHGCFSDVGGTLKVRWVANPDGAYIFEWIEQNPASTFSVAGEVAVSDLLAREVPAMLNGIAVQSCLDKGMHYRLRVGHLQEG